MSVLTRATRHNIPEDGIVIILRTFAVSHTACYLSSFEILKELKSIYIVVKCLYLNMNQFIEKEFQLIYLDHVYSLCVTFRNTFVFYGEGL
jgi:hypothetical protein